MIKLGNLAHGMVKLKESEEQIEISGISADSRKVGQGYLFAALPGTRVDGAEFTGMAILNGARVILTGNDSPLIQTEVPIIRVPDPRLAFAQIAARFYPLQPKVTVAVTGTSGKTSVVEFVRQIWQKTGKISASIGTIGVITAGYQDHGSLTTPDSVVLHETLQELCKQGVNHVAMEASSHGLEQKRLDGVCFNAAGFTNLGRDHLDYHHSMEAYYQAKERLFSELLPKGGVSVVFVDDPFGERIAVTAKTAGREVLRVGRKGDYLRLKRVEHERYAQIVEITHGSRIFRVKFPLAGGFQIANSLVAAGLVLSGGEDVENIIASLETLEGVPGRLDLAGRTKSNVPIYIDYAHKPEALESVLSSLRVFTSRQLVVVFGCGGDRDHGKRPIMGEIAERLADRVIVTDDNPRTEDAREIRKAILAGASSATEIGDRRQAIQQAIDNLGEGDCLLIAGKGHETGQIIGDQTLEFSDHEVVREILGERVP